MIQRLFILCFALLVQACASPSYRQSAFPTPDLASSATEVCTYQSEHFTFDGLKQEAAYYCTPFLRPATNNVNALTINSANVVNSSGCTFVASYTKKDGSLVGPYMRCKSYQEASGYKAITTTSLPAPCITSYCGPVNVKGYYRKDGTYVRPHTRKR